MLQPPAPVGTPHISTLSEFMGPTATSSEQGVQNLTSNIVRAINTSQQYPVFMRKYEGRVFTGVIRHVNCLLNTGNTTSPGIAISSHLAQELGLDIVLFGLDI